MALLRATKVKLGQKVRDTITGLEGTVISRTEWLYGCVRVAVQGEGGKDGVPYDPFVVDEPQLEVVEVKAAPKVKPSHGPRSDPGRSPNPTRAALESDLTVDQEAGDETYIPPERRR